MKSIRFLFALLAITTIISPFASAMHPCNPGDEDPQGNSKHSGTSQNNDVNIQSLHMTNADIWLLQSGIKDDYKDYLLNMSSSDLSFNMFDDEVILPGLRVWAIDGQREGRWTLPPYIFKSLIEQVGTAEPDAMNY